jgi:branched-subunit amino acid ABC-type transport system permease component
VIGRAHIGDQVIAEVIPGAEYISILVVLLMVLLIRPQGLVGREA